MTTTALIVIVIIVGLLANAALIYVALSRLRDAPEIGHGRRPAARSIHEAWHRPEEPVTASTAVPRIARVRAVPPPDPVTPVRAESEAEEDRVLAEAIADFVRSAQAVAQADQPSTSDGDADVAPEPYGGVAPQRGRVGRASVVVVDVQAGSGRVGLGQRRDIEVSVARVLRRTARDADEVRQLGEASFAVLLAGTRGPGAEAFVGRARTALADVLAPHRGSTFSIAAEDVADVADNPDEALRRALRALDAKREDRPKRGRPVAP